MESDQKKTDFKINQEAIIQEGLDVQNLMKMPGFKVLFDQFKHQKEELNDELLSDKLPSEPKARLLAYEVKRRMVNEFEIVLNTPQHFIDKMHNAVKELKNLNSVPVNKPNADIFMKP